MLIILISNGLFSQTYYWKKLNDESIYDIISDGDYYLYYTGENGVFRSSDYGESWIEINSGLNGRHPWCLAMDSSQVIWAGINFPGGLYKSTDNGNNWDLTNLISAKIYSLEVNSSNVVIAGGEDSVYISFDQGQSWSSSYVSDRIVWGLASNRIDDIFAVGEGIFRSTNNGSSWEAVYSNRNPSEFNIDNNDNIYAAMNYLGIMKSSDNGENWDTISYQPAEYITSDRKGIFYGSWYGIHESLDSCVNWIYRGLTGDIRRIAILDTIIFAGGIGSGIYKYDPSFVPYVGNNYYPLNIGNKWQYFYYTSWGYENIYLDSVVADTSIGNLKYFKLEGLRNDWVRYSDDDKKLFIRWNDSDYVHMDFNLNANSSFTQINFNDHQIREAKVIDPGIYSVFDSSFYYKGYNYTWAAGTDYDSRTYKFAESIGEVYYRFSSEGPGGSSGSGVRKIIRAIINDGSNVKHLSDKQKPVIQFDPILVTNELNIELNFQVDHAYTYSNSGNLSDFVDSVIYYSHYSNLDTIISKDTLLVFSEPNSIHYHLELTLDSLLMQDDFNYYYKIYAVDKGIVPEFSFSPDSGYYALVYDTSTTYIKDEDPSFEYLLENNYPNPFNPTTTITYQIPELNFVSLKVYDVLGNEIATLVNEEKPAGNYEVEFYGVGLTSGIYFYKLKTGSFAETKKMILIK